MTSRRVLSVGGLVVGSVVIAAAIAVALTPVDPDPTADGHGWRAEYYRDLLFLGDPLVRRETQLSFDWARGTPFPERRPIDRFSIRWDTCLDVPSATTVEIALTSDDGSRLFVDGRQIADNWGEHGTRTVGARHPVATGSYHLLVEYFEMSRDARVTLALEQNGTPVPREWLRIPRRPHAAPDVCAR